MPAAERNDGERLRAELAGRYLQQLHRAHVRWGVAASTPIWLDALWPVVPGFVVWAAVLATGACLSLAAGEALLEARAGGRARAGASGTVLVHAAGGPADEVRSALWVGLALVSLVPCAHAALARACPPVELAALAADAIGLLLLLAVVETVSVLVRCTRGEQGRLGHDRWPLQRP